MLARNRTALQQILDAVGDDKTLHGVYLLDTSGRIAFAPGGIAVGSRFDNRDPNCQPCHSLPPAERPKSVVITLANGQRVFRTMSPIENEPACHSCHDPSQPLTGELLTDISMASVEAPLAADLREHIAWWAVTILTTILIVNVALSRFVIRRLTAVAQALARFGRGQLDLRLPLGSPDEIGQVAATFNEMGQRLQSEEAENRALSQDLRREAAQRHELLKRLITSQEEERRRVARDLHDDFGQDLGGLALNLEAVERLWAEQPEQARQQLRQVRAYIADMTNRAYDMILALRPSALDDLGLVPALRAHAERALRGSSIRFKLESDGFTCRLPPEIETALFRTLQEALSNVVRHARANHVLVSLAARDGVFEGEIVDDGQGFDVRAVQANGHGPRGLGLLGMQERMAQWHGVIEIVSQPGAGTRLRIRMPLPRDGA
jgi:signal transduction histidine kinase